MFRSEYYDFVCNIGETVRSVIKTLKIARVLASILFGQVGNFEKFITVLVLKTQSFAIIMYLRKFTM